MTINFEKLSLKQLLNFCDALHTTPSFQQITVERKFNAEALFFQETLNLLLMLELITNNEDNKITPSDEFIKILNKPQDRIKTFFLRRLLKKLDFIDNDFSGFLNQFKPQNNNYVFAPDIKQRLKYSGIRNFLIGLGGISSITPEGTYVASDQISTYLLDRKRLLPYTEFDRQLKAIEELGRRAELLVLEKEKSLFKEHPNILKKIEHTSIIDVSAGYDIKSFEKISKKGGIQQPKYIEVKAVSLSDLKFYWSKNEISEAKYFGKSYYLYLLPVKSEFQLDISSLMQIQDPYHTVFQDQNEWEQEIETISFYRKNHAKIKNQPNL